MARLLLSRLIGAFILLAATSAQAQDVTVYDDALQNGFENWSWPVGDPNIDFNATAQHHGGTKSISFVGNAWNAVSFAHPAPFPAFTTVQYPTLHFWVHGGTVGGQHLRVILELAGFQVANAALDTYIAGGTIAATAWREVTVVLGNAPLSYAGSFDRIDLQSDVAGGQPVLYIDDVSLLAPSAPPAPNLIQIEQNVQFDPGYPTFLSDRFTWRDSADKPRVAVLTHNNPEQEQGPTVGYPNHGGALREFRYQLPADNATRIATMTTYGNGGYGGFGYVVSHASNYAGCVGDDSPLGYGTTGQYQRIFEGRHHVIFRFTQNYPRNCSTTAPVMARTIPVTIDWVFSTGRDNPVWAVTWDVDLVQPPAPVDTFWDDTRGPYGELNIDGDGWTNIDGVAWGDRYKFTSTSAPVTLASQWTYNVANTVPYVKLWLAAPMVMPGHTKDATMGIVQTQTMTQQDAAGARIPGYHDITECWNKTSATCAWAGDPDTMPWQDDWAYQANADSIGGGANGNARLTWRTQYGFIGQATYVVHDGVVPDPPGRPGYPKKSYSTYVVLGTHSSAPVEAQVTQVEAVQSLVLSTLTGSVVTSGPAGVARADNVTYAPAGYNHVYGALAFTAAANLLDANIAVGAGTLKKPLVIVGSFTGALPTVKLAGVTLTQDVDYFPSLRTAANELWITLNSDLAGAINHLEILLPAGAVVPTIAASGPTTFCAGGSVTLTASTAPGAGVSYLWSPGGATTRAILVTTSGSYTVTVTVAGVPGTSLPTVVTVNPIPATPVITAPPHAVAGQTLLVASVTNTAGGTILWGITNGAITAGQGTTSITFTAGAIGTLGLSVVETTPALCPSLAGTASVGVIAAGTVAVDVYPTLDRRPVSPLIFGVNFGDGAQLALMHWPIRRWGGTPTSRYNWNIDVANSGNDYLFFNTVNPLPPLPAILPDGSTADVFIDETRLAGSEPFMTVPILGWTAVDRNYRYGFSIASYGPQQLNECTFTGQVPPACNLDMGNGIHTDGVTPVTGNNPADTSVAVVNSSLVTGWKTHIAGRTGTAGAGGVKYFGLDNEPMLWNYAHRDVHPNGTTYDEHWTKGRDIAAALKAQDPAVQIIGPNEWGWCGWLDSSADYDTSGNCFVLGPDAVAHGSMQFSAWWLAQAQAYELAHGIRIVDTFSLHFYPQGNAITFSDPNGDTPTTQALRLRSLKELYDRNWLSESWIGDNGGKIFLIPRMRDWIAANYPGTKLAIGEYNFGDVGVSSALAQAEALAIFGREGVDMALRWTAPPPNTVIEDAFSLYMNYDGAGSKVSGDSIRAISSNVDTVGGYAVRDTGAHPGRLYVLLFNKDTVATSTTVNVTGQAIQSPVSLWRFNTSRLAGAGTVVPAVGSFTLSLPARSATLAVVDLVVEPAGLVEDAHATGSTISNVNKVLEPGETVLVNASWKNVSAAPLALTGTASAFTGPGGATYSLLDTAAGYGIIAPGATADSFSAGGPSYRLSVSNPVTRPAAHWDATFLETLSDGIAKTWTLHIGQSFTDVPVGDGAYPFVESLLHNGITAGCVDGSYCPGSNITRWQMAVFLSASMVGPSGTVPASGAVPGVGSYNCSLGGNSLFADVPPTDAGCRFIHYIYAQGLTGGCGGGNYCPATNVTRWQMAVFLATGMVGPSGTVPTSGVVPSVGAFNCSPGGTSLFGDVSPTDGGCRFIHYIYANGVTSGCGGGNYCPANNVTRWQMAVFLVTAFKIPFLY